MAAASIVCEACRRAAADETIDLDDPEAPYRVCRPCGERLAQQALRPLEWFNLAAIHGWGKFLLHDDFYEQDGTARNPMIDDYAVDGLFAPTLDEVSQDLDRLLDFCVTRWWLRKPEIRALGAFDDDTVLGRIRQRAERGNLQVHSVCLRLCANVVGPTAAPWVREQFARSCDEDILFSWAEAAAKCLPTDEGLQKTQDALSRLEGFSRENRMNALAWFRSSAVLDWIEQNVPPANVTGNWGLLAARSDPSWERVRTWISSGRPLSIVALDTLIACIYRQDYPFPLSDIQPALRGCPDRSVICAVLERHMEVDDAPRPVDRCRSIIDRIAELRIADTPDRSESR